MASQKLVPTAASSINATSSSSSNISNTATATNHHFQPQEPPISYILYLHREELRKRKASCMRISRTKFQLTHELITKTVKNIHKCSADDLQILSRETIFKKNLRRQIARMRHFQYMQMIKHQQQQNEKFQKQQRPQEHYHPHHQMEGVYVMQGIETSAP